MRNVLFAGVLALLSASSIDAQDVYRPNANITRPTLVEMSKPLYGAWVIMNKGGGVKEFDQRSPSKSGFIYFTRCTR